MRAFYNIFCILLCLNTFSQAPLMPLHDKVLALVKNQDLKGLRALSDTSAIIAKMAFAGQLRVFEKQLQRPGKKFTFSQSLADSQGCFIAISNVINAKKARYIFSARYDAQQRLTGLSIDTFDVRNPGIIYENPLLREPFYSRTDITITVNEKASLGGYVYKPLTPGKYPLVILVHGSGGHDRFCSIGPNKVFLDMALKLVKRNIAVLVYDKITYAYATHLPFPLDSMSYMEETVNDAVSAYTLAQAVPGIDSRRIFIAGHSQGALCGPLIARHCKDLRGLILLAAPARPLLEIIPEQMDYIATTLETDPEKEAFEEQAKSLQWLVKNAMKPELNVKSKTPLPFGARPRYWLFDRSYKVLDTARTLSMPILLVQGGRDYNVTRTDYNLWLKAMQDKNNFKATWLADLDHLYFKGEGMAKPKDLELPQHVDKQVTDAMAEFVETLK